MRQFLKELLFARRVGRLGRLPYFLGLTAVFLVWIVVFLGIYAATHGGLDIGESGFSLSESLWGAALIYPFLLILAAGRLNDIGINGWFSLLLLGNLATLLTSGCSIICDLYTLLGIFLFVMPGRKGERVLRPQDTGLSRSAGQQPQPEGLVGTDERENLRSVGSPSHGDQSGQSR